MKIIPWDGQPISAPGIYTGVPMATYHGRLCVGDTASKSILWPIIEQSAAHAYLTHYSNEDREDQTTKPMLFGRASHHLILGEANFNREFIMQPSTYPEGAAYPSMIGAEKTWSNNAKWCKAWHADQVIHGLTVLTGADLDNIRGVAGGLYAHPMVRAGILNGHIETTLIAYDDDNGIWLKIRPDGMPNDSGDVADLKVVADITDEGIERSIGETGIALQGGMIRRVMRLLGHEMTSFSLVFAESKAPYCVRVKTLIDGDLDLGEQLLDTALPIYARCLARNVWPGPGGDQVDAEYTQMSPFKRGRLERRMQQLNKELSL